MKSMQAILAVVIVVGGLAGCQTTQTGQSPGDVASETVRQHPGTVIGAGAGAAGGAVVGGLAGGTKGAVIGGLLGGLAGGVIGNYIERRDDTATQVATAPAPGTPPVVAAPPPIYRPEEGPGVRMDRVLMTPAVVRPGGTVNLGATYTVLTPAEQWLTVRETREVRYQGELVANPTTQVSRTNGTYTTSLPITLPSTAATGPYEVTTTVALGDRRASQTTTFHVQ
jgi:Glycine zipper